MKPVERDGVCVCPTLYFVSVCTGQKSTVAADEVRHSIHLTYTIIDSKRKIFQIALHVQFHALR